MAKSPFEMVYRGILRGLYEGRYVPGQRLAAPDLIRDFGAGRGTVREVLQRLGASGVVRIATNRGAAVRRFTRREVAEILDIVEVLLGLAARTAATAVGIPAMRAEFERNAAALRHAASRQEFDRFLVAREHYYRFLFAASGNRELQMTFPNIQVHIMRVQLRPFDRAADSFEAGEFDELDAAVLSGDADRAEIAGRAHVQRTSKRVSELPDRAFEAER